MTTKPCQGCGLPVERPRLGSIFITNWHLPCFFAHASSRDEYSTHALVPDVPGWPFVLTRQDAKFLKINRIAVE